MLSKLFRPKWQHENPAIRKNAIEKMGIADIAILEELVISDKDADVRNTALSRIDDISIIERLINGKKISDEDLALKRWAYALTESGRYNPLEQEKIITECLDEKYLGSLVAHSENENVRNLALAGITSEATLLSLLEKTRNGRSWQTIIGKLSSEDALKKANVIINGRDKKSQQTIKARLEEFRKSQQTAREFELQAQQLTTRLEHLIATESNPLFEGILLSSRQQYHILEPSLVPEKRLAIQALFSLCQERINKELAIKTASRIAEETQQQMLSEQETLLKQMEELASEAETLGADTIRIEEALTHIGKQWPVSDMPSRANDKLQHLSARITQGIKANEMIAAKSLAELSSQDALSKLGYSATQRAISDTRSIQRQLTGTNNHGSIKHFLDLLMQSLEQHQKGLVLAGKQLHKEIRTGLSELDSLLDRKELQSSRKLFNRIKAAFEQLPEHESLEYGNELQRLHHTLRDLEDWKTYASDGKRQELCARMQSLIDAEMDIQLKADTIKTLQDEWKSLGHCNNEKLWNTFKSLADAAYAPCQEHFRQLRAIRKFNAEQCTVICKQLEDLLESQDWSNVDWKIMDNLYKAFHEEWKRFSPLEREAYKTLQDRFHHNTRQLKSRLDNERNLNNRKLAGLVERAKALLDNPDIQQAIDEYNKLQAQWKNTGITFHKQQQQQWAEFRKAGDNLYQKRQNLRNEADHERLDNLSKAYEIISEINNLSNLPDDELAHSRASFEILKSSFKLLGSLPKDDFKPCNNTFNHSCDKYEERFSSIGKRQWSKSLTNLQSLGEHWRQAEIHGNTPDLQLARGLLPESWIQHLQQRLAPATQLPQPECARLICIEMESLAGMETPAEDAALKMQWQMANLAKNFGHHQPIALTQKAEELYLRWYSQQCWNADEYTHLEGRFIEAAKTLLKH